MTIDPSRPIVADQSHPISADTTMRHWPGGYMRCRETEAQGRIVRVLSAMVGVPA